jgi:hypothetical protein
MADRSAGAALAVLLAWAWGLWVPSQPMPAEVAAMLGYLLGPVVEDIRRIRAAVAARIVTRLDAVPQPKVREGAGDGSA